MGNGMISRDLLREMQSEYFINIYMWEVEFIYLNIIEEEGSSYL